MTHKAMSEMCRHERQRGECEGFRVGIFVGVCCGLVVGSLLAYLVMR